MEVKFKRLAKEATIPSYTEDSNAGLGLIATRFSQEFDRSGKMILIYHTDLSVEIPEGYIGLLFHSNSITNMSLSLTECVGLVKPGESGEIVAKFKITTDALPTIYQPKEQVMQLLIMPCPTLQPIEVENTILTDSSESAQN